jgi:hypothetical protein
MTRSSPFDLEVGGEINALPAASARDLTQADLLALPQMSASVSDARTLRGRWELEECRLNLRGSLLFRVTPRW